ncbi:hypothetical protein [Actinomadura sediminis]|uniref:DUF2218 domain-containing protein n=1 Tax=Actinomadura sediminis TaxID=1038904 RepID=A0ABW3EL45_9ACTN
MSADLVALVRRRPDVHAVADGLIALGEPLELRGGAPAAMRLHGPDGRLLVSVEDAVRVSVQGEIGRLLGAEFAERVKAPVWWVDVRAVADVPEAERVARRFADSLVHWLGGAVYPDGEHDGPALSWKAADAEAGGAGVPGEPGPAAEGAYQGGVAGR